ncbi:Cytochrome [Abeliophyllum distichum]|uniref:Cytochrome n=1 Tax=Abeliophyllum distichum TaxID=126358 RepID=A0ABD1Q3V8_9LAMI
MFNTLMEFYSWFPVVFFLIFVLSLLFLMKPKTAALSNLPPSPPRLPIIGNLHQLGNIPHRSMWKLSQKYGPVMLLQLGQVPNLVVSSAEMAKQVLRTHDQECCSRPYSYGAMKLSYNLLDVAFGPHSEYWRELRKICVIKLFAVKRVQSFWNVREKEVARLINSISESSSYPIEVNEKIFSVTNNIICSIAFGKSYEGKQFEGYYKFQEAIDDAMAMLGSFWAADFFPNFGWILDVITGLRRRLEKCFQDFDAFFEGLIDEHLDPDRPRPEHEDIIDVLLEVSKDETAPIHLSRDHIKSTLMDIFIGAINTSSLTMIWAMTELARNPRVMKKAQVEIRSCVRRKPRVSENEIPKLKYLKNVVKETFRLHPPVTLLLPRESMRPCKIGGYDIPAKTRIHVNAWAIGRDPETWKNPEEFYPERFEDNDVDFRGNHYELIPFGAGRRICPGLTMGSTAIEFTLANLLHCFDWGLPDGMQTEDISVEEEAGLTVNKKYSLYLVPIKYDWRQ